MKKIEDFITENEWKILSFKTSINGKWEEDNKRHLILGLEAIGIIKTNF